MILIGGFLLLFKKKNTLYFGKIITLLFYPKAFPVTVAVTTDKTRNNHQYINNIFYHISTVK